MAFLFHFDEPTELPPGGSIPVRGWVASDAPILSVSCPKDAAITLRLEERPDVRRAMPDYRFTSGFRGLVPQEHLDHDLLSLVCELEGRTERLEIRPPRSKADSWKAQRLARLRPLLREDMPYKENEFHFDFLPPELRAQFHVSETEAVSEFDYAPAVKELLAALPSEGLALDCGAGRRSKCLPNVVNLEIVPYPSSDVLATNEVLPFRDNSFDLVISCAVLEHVRDPFAAAKEIVRVTKPGGQIHADVPFLQPYHGYPSHYYNMTHQGLANLFSDGCEIEKSFVPRYGTPIWTLTWFLNTYLAGLPEEERARFADMKVSELLGKPELYLEQPFVAQLSDEKNLELASVTSLLARKR